MKEKTTRETIAEIMGGDDVDAGKSEETAPEVVQEAAPEPAAATQEVDEAPEAPAAKTRGPDGKFAPKPAAAAPAEAAPVVDAPALPKLKAPADWRPAAAAKFDSLPREAQEEAIRLHVETKKTLQEAAQHRQAAETWQKTVAPYEHMFRASGKTAQEGVGWLVQQYAALQTAPIPQRIGIVAGLIRDFIGVDEQSINILASHLEGKPAPAQPVGAVRPENVAEMVRKQLADERKQAAVQIQHKAIADFEASNPEYLDKVAPQIKALVTVALQEGQTVTPELLKKSYDHALRMNPETAAILKQRDDAAAAEKQAAAEAKKRAAASGVRSEPAGPAGGGNKRPMSTRDQLKQDFESAERNRV